MLVQLGNSKQLAWLVEVDQTPEPQPHALSSAMVHGAPHFVAKPQTRSAGGLVLWGKFGDVALGNPRLAGSR